MPWDFGAGVAAAAGAGAGLIGDSIKRERDLQGATDLEALKQKIEQDKQARVAAVLASVSRTKDVPIAGPTVDGSSLGVETQPKPEGEYRRERGDALSKAGLIDYSEKEYTAADRHEENMFNRTTQAAKQKSDDEKWRGSEARLDKHLNETIRHNNALEAKANTERISPAAKAQLEMASVYVSSAHRAESEAGKALDAIRKNVAADPVQVQAAETEYKLSKTATANALKQYDEIGAAHFGDEWKKVTELAPTAAASIRVYDPKTGTFSGDAAKPAVTTGAEPVPASGLIEQPVVAKKDFYLLERDAKNLDDQIARLTDRMNSPQAAAPSAKQSIQNEIVTLAKKRSIVEQQLNSLRSK